MLFSDISILAPDFTIQEHQYVAVQGTAIRYVGSTRPQGEFGPVYEGKEKLLLPGLVNTHSHSPMTLLRGYAENLPLDRWLNEKVFPFEDRIQGEDAYYAVLLSIAEMLRTGTTSFSDMYFFSENVAKAVGDSGIKCNFSRSIVSFEDGDIRSLPSFQESEAMIRQYHGAFEGRFLMDMSLHAEYTNRVSIMEQFAQAAKDHNLRVQIHLSETKKEHEECKQRHGGLTPAQVFAKAGVLDQPTVAAHCVWVEDRDMELMAEKGVRVATCPASNLKLGSGVCNLPELRKHGVKIAIGTDSAASNNNLNLWKELYLAALLPKGITHDPTAVTPQQVLEMATVQGCASQGRMDCGKIQTGYRADLTVLDLSGPHMTPATDLLNNLIYAVNGFDTILTMVDGKVLYENGEYPTIDLERVKYEVSRRTRRIIGEVAQG